MGVIIQFDRISGKETGDGKMESKHWTNADKIRSMTEDELAKFLGFVAQDAFCYGRGIRDKMILYPFGEYESTIEWLREEAKVES